ncbi:MAG: DUF1015 domain-containing protein [Fibrobacterales bacterium]
MADRAEKLAKLGLQVPQILLPKSDVDMQKWAVIACDQYTSQREYWTGVEKVVADAPSTLNITFPEAYLEDGRTQEIIDSINKNMKQYVADDILEEKQPGAILIDRKTEFVESKKGLLFNVDLEHYDFSVGSTSLIRASEGTILDRIPPRKMVRQDASIELPHILFLIDDPKRSIVEPLFEKRDSFDKIYDFELMQGAGHISGWMVSDEDSLNQITDAIEAIADPAQYKLKYGSDNPLLFAVGDGNHSLATAKTIWEELKAENPNDAELMNHPARYALVEINNVYDEGLTCEAIHRTLFNVDPEKFVAQLKKFYNVEIVEVNDTETMVSAINAKNGYHKFAFNTASKKAYVSILNPKHTLDVGSVQLFMDEFLAQNPKTTVDYIHGIDTTVELGNKEGNMGILLPEVEKSSLFPTVIKEGVFPRKSFSLGEASEKRFYVESRKIVR